MDNLLEALKLMVVGMITVFVILLIVIYLGKLLIFFVNKFFPEKDLKITANVNSAISVDPTTTAIINEAVKVITDSKGTVINIKKI